MSRTSRYPFHRPKNNKKSSAASKHSSKPQTRSTRVIVGRKRMLTSSHNPSSQRPSAVNSFPKTRTTNPHLCCCNELKETSQPKSRYVSRDKDSVHNTSLDAILGNLLK